jgi:hypothetical protein
MLDVISIRTLCLTGKASLMKKRLLYVLMFSFLLSSCAKSVTVAEEDGMDQSYHHQRVGVSARALLADEQFASLKIEVQYMTGFEPDERALLNLRDFLYDHLHKPSGISIITKEIAPIADTSLTMPEIISLEKKNRTVFATGKELTVYVLYTNGYYVDDHMLGYAYQNTSIVLFGKNLDDNSNKFKKLNRSDLETRVLQHEMAHLMGLVNVGTDLQSDHKDNEHGKHCLNKQCLMYYLTDTEQSPGVLLRKGIPKLDEACLADLRANGGK